MSALILHLTDLHIGATQNVVVNRAEAIARSLNGSLSGTSAVFIAVSGDIAQSGQKEQYEIARSLLRTIALEIKKEKDVPVEFVFVPGNHDCDFTGSQVVRNSVLKDIVSHGGSVPMELVDELSKVQNRYFEFRNELINYDAVLHDDRLWTVQEFVVEGKRIWFDSLNASGMSTIHEKPGAVFFPFEGYQDFKPTDADLRIGMIHHPLNWYSQINYQGFKSFLHSLEDFLLTGHEHSGNAGIRQDARNGECAFIEGAALQINGRQESGFNLLELRLESAEFRCDRFEYIDGRYLRQNDEIWLPIRPMPQRTVAELQISKSFQKTLCDPGATLHHPDKRDLCLDDFYVFPDLDVQSSERRMSGKNGTVPRKKSSKALTVAASVEKEVILEGDENAGKTRLLYQLFQAYHAQNRVPVLIDGRKIKSSSDLDKLLAHAVAEQYGKENLVAYEQTSRDKKILLIDDFDQAPLQDRFKAKLYEFMSQRFETRIITVGENFRVGELFSGDKLAPLSSFVHYKIMPFGYERRGELVMKWNRLGLSEVTPTNQWLSACTQAEKLIEAAKLQHVATTVPILVLSLLNLGTSGVAKEMHNSSFAHYFYFLIVGALDKAGVRQEALSKFLGFATHLSWFVKHNGTDHEITELEFRRFCKSYSHEWMTTVPEEMIDVLSRARIICVNGDCISFTYQYAYYYFLGRYTNSFIDDGDVKAYLAYCMKHLYVRECANTLLFLAHHSGNSLVLDGVIAALGEHFATVCPVNFSKEDIGTVSTLISNAPAMIYEHTDPVSHRSEVHKFQDENDSGSDGLAAAPRLESDKRNFIDEITSVSKTIEIAAALLTNQYANLTRDKKNQSIKLIFETALKAIRGFYEIIGHDPERLVKELANRVKSKKQDLSFEDSEKITRQALAWVLKIVSTAFVEKAGQHLGSPVLADNVDDVVTQSPTLAMKLIKLGQQISGPGRLPQGAIKEILRDEKDNPCVMSIMQLLVLKRLYMYETEHDDKDWAITTFKLGGATRPVEFANRQQRLAGRA
jgi:hypothetical protein